MQNCSDHDPGSLRDIVENPANAQSGDIVDLSHLPTSCGIVNSVVTLGAEITIDQDDLTLVGPASGQGSVTISGADASRVLRHAGAGTLALLDLGIAHGYYQSINSASGGCILSMGSVSLKNAVVTGCKAKSSMSAASGGGIAAHYAVALDHSSVSGNAAIAPTTGAYGGGIRAGSFLSKYSSVSANSAISGVRGLGCRRWTDGVRTGRHLPLDVRSQQRGLWRRDPRHRLDAHEQQHDFAQFRHVRTG